MTVRTLLLGSLLAVTLAASAAVDGEEKEAHGGFSGEVKPVLYVADVERSAEFYRDVLGFAFEGFAASEGRPYYAEMAAGSQTFGLHQPMNDRDGERVGCQRLYFRVRDLAAHRRRVEAWGSVAGEVVRRDWMDYFVVVDADGNEIVFAETDPARHPTDPW